VRTVRLFTQPPDWGALNQAGVRWELVMAAPLHPEPPLRGGGDGLPRLRRGVPAVTAAQGQAVPAEGVTGRLGVAPTPGKVKAWRPNRQPRDNLALRLAAGRWLMQSRPASNRRPNLGHRPPRGARSRPGEAAGLVPVTVQWSAK